MKNVNSKDYCAFQSHANSEVQNTTEDCSFTVINHNDDNQLTLNKILKQTKWIKIYQSQPTDVTFLTC